MFELAFCAHGDIDLDAPEALQAWHWRALHGVLPP
jgi:hypothetical protein